MDSKEMSKEILTKSEKYANENQYLKS